MKSKRLLPLAIVAGVALACLATAATVAAQNLAPMAPNLAVRGYQLILQTEATAPLLTIDPISTERPFNELYAADNVKITVKREPVVTKNADGTWSITLK